MSTKVLTDLDLDNNDLLNVGSGGGGSSPLTTKGDLYTYDTADQRLPVGTDGQILSANSATATGLEWIANTGGGGGGGTNEGASVSRSTDTAITPSVLFPIVWENEDDDDNGYVDLGANNTRITIPEDGTYLVRVQLAFENTVSTNEIRSVRLRLNGSTVISRADQAALANGTNATIVQVTWMGDLVATDYLEATAFIVEAGIDLIASSSSFSIEKIPAGGGGTGGSGGSGTNTYVELTRTTNQTIATGAPGTVVEWENEVHDTDNLVDLGSSNTDIVVSEAGEYILYFEFVWNANATSFRQVAVLVNGTPVSSVRDIPATSGNAVTAGTSIVLDLSASDVISIRVRQDTGSNLDLTGTQRVRLVQFKAGGGGTGGSGGGYAENIGDGVATSFVVTHNLGTRDIVAQVWETASPYDQVLPLISATSENTVTIDFDATVPTTDQYRVFVTSGGGAGSGVRELLTADRTYYVATTGSDSNDGLTVGTPFLTIQKAVDVAATLDLGGFNVIVDIANGTYTTSQAITIPLLVGGGISFEGDQVTPSNVVVDANGDFQCFTTITPTVVGFKGISFDHDTGGVGSGSRMGIQAQGQAQVNVEDCNFITGRYIIQLGDSATARFRGTNFISGDWDIAIRNAGAGYLNTLFSTWDITGAAHNISSFFTLGAGGVSDSRNTTYNTSSGGAWTNVSPGTVNASILDVSGTTLPFANPTVTNNGTLIT